MDKAPWLSRKRRVEAEAIVENFWYPRHLRIRHPLSGGLFLTDGPVVNTSHHWCKQAYGIKNISAGPKFRNLKQ
jgi:hypothetical protein